MTWRTLGILFLFALAVRFFTLGSAPLFDMTEGRYAEIGRLMVTTNQWAVGQLPGHVSFWGKPPLHFWLTAASFKVFGLTEFAARLPSFLGACLVLVFTFLIARRLYGRVTGAVACVMLLSTGLFHVLAGFVALDMTLAAAVTGAMASFIAMAESSDRKNKNVFNFLFFLALGIGFLTKGPVVLALCVGAIFIAVVLSRSLSNLKVPSWLLGGIVFLAIVIPWMVVAEKQSPGILKYFFLNENVLRFLKSDYGDRYGYAHNFPPGAILIFLMLGCLPWTPLYFLAFWRVFRSEGRASHADTLLLGWALSSVALFFFSRNIAATYVLPSVPAFAILGARYLSQAQSMVIRSPLRFSTLASLAPGLMLCFSVFFAREIGRIRSTGEVVKAVQERAPATGNPILFFDEVPYSAEFYSGGNVLPLYHSTRALSEKMASAPRSIVIVHEKSEKPLQEFIPSRLKLLFAVGSQHVYQMN